MSKFNRILLTINILFGILLLSATASSAVDSNVISACVAKSNGAVRIGSNCTKSERVMTWNKTGVQGEKGDNANISIRTITIHYPADPNGETPYSMTNRCGEGEPAISRGYSYSFPGGEMVCTITLKVVQ